MIETSCEESSTGECSLLCCCIGICPFELGTNPARQRRFLSVPPTLLCWHKSVSPTLRSHYPTGQVRRKERYRCAVSRNERHCASTAAQSPGLNGESALPLAYRKSAQYASHSAIF